MTPEDFLIHELAKKAGVSVRTVRYYINEGLLPVPENKGRYASYNTEYLDRLELIRRLKEAYLPLKEIRERIGSLTSRETRELLAQMDAESQPDAQTPPQADESKPLSSALSYINQIMETQTKSAQPTRPLPPVTPHPPPAAQQSRHASPTQSWQRVILAPGVELHIQQPDSSAHQRRIQQLIDFARSVFTHNQ